MAVIEFLVDENAPADIVEFLESRGHVVHYVGDVFPKGTPDSVLLGAAEIDGLVVLTFDRDFRTAIRQMIPRGYARRTERLAGRLSFTCRETEALGRLVELIDVVEFHYARELRAGKRFIMQISETSYNFTG